MSISCLILLQNVQEGKRFEILRDKMIENGDKFLAIPLIGAGLDRLSWDENRETIKRVFKDTDIEILVCKI